jgi:hypothetical protein
MPLAVLYIFIEIMRSKRSSGSTAALRSNPHLFPPPRRGGGRRRGLERFERFERLERVRYLARFTRPLLLDLLFHLFQFHHVTVLVVHVEEVDLVREETAIKNRLFNN